MYIFHPRYNTGILSKLYLVLYAPKRKHGVCDRDSYIKLNLLDLQGLLGTTVP